MAFAMRSIYLVVIAALSFSGTYAMSSTDLCGGCQNGGNCTTDANGQPVCDCGLCFTGALCEQPRVQRNPCLCFQCENGGTCQSPVDIPVCICPPGFTGERCEQRIGRSRPIFDPCGNVTCDNGGFCIAPADGPFCQCPAGFGGARCRQTEKPGSCPKSGSLSVCGRDACKNDFECPGDQKCCANCGYRCTEPIKDNCPREPCPVGEACATRGPYCPPGSICPAIARIGCEPTPCLDCTDQETCIPIFFSADGGQKYLCQDVCQNFRCQNGGTCRPVAPSGEPFCFCPEGYTGEFCEVAIGSPGTCPPVDPNSVGICGGTFCTNDNQCGIGEKCCDSACGGQLCTRVNIIFDPCAGFVCQNGGRCSAPADAPICLCPDGFTGTRCELKQEPCPTQPCPPGETCIITNPCPPGAQCFVPPIRACVPVECVNCSTNEECAPISEATDLSMITPGARYFCRPIITRDPCANYQCLNGGYCTAPVDNPYCVCPDGYSGRFCEVKGARPGTCPTITPNSGGICGGTFCKNDNQCGIGEKCCDSACGGQLCTRVIISFNPCAGFVCQNGGRCSAPADAPICLCPDGFTGSRCELKQRPCPTQLCPQGEVCVDRSPCPPGSLCLAAVIPTCVPVDCANCASNEECVPISEATDLSLVTPGRRYFCRPIFTRDPCANHRCLNGGYCTAPADYPYCVCPDGYSGQFCEMKDTRPGTCPTITNDTVGVCGGIFCSNDHMCPDGQKCCPSACGGNLCTSVGGPVTILPPPPPLTCASVLCIIGTVCQEVLDSSGRLVARCINQTLISPDVNNVCRNAGYVETLLAEIRSQLDTYGPASCLPGSAQSCPDGYVCASDSRGGGVCCTGKPCGNSVCYPGEVCELIQPPCAPGMFCIQALIPTCVRVDCRNCAPNEECVPVPVAIEQNVITPSPVQRYQCAPTGDCRTQGCPTGQECKQFTLCVDPAPGSPITNEFGCRDVYECAEQQDRCGGCPRGQTCELLYPPCPPPPDCDELRAEDPNALCPMPVCEPIPTCVGEPSEPDLCGGCPDDQVCQLTDVVCKTYPCNPVPQCVPADPCGRCDDDEVCTKKTAERCFRYPCPETYECVKKDFCDGECDDDEVCIDTGIRCVTTPCPTYQCVENNECGGCRPGQKCIDAGIRCVTTPCPTYQCVDEEEDEEEDECGGCPEGQRCDFIFPPCARPPDCDVLRELNPDAECITPSCDPIPICVDDPQITTTPQPEVCPLRCPHNYRCEFKKSTCRFPFCRSRGKEEPECVLVEPEARTCPSVTPQRNINSFICRMEVFVQRNECEIDNDCEGRNEKCCTSKCNRKVCLNLNRRLPFLG